MGLALGEEVVTPDERAVVADFIAFLKEASLARAGDGPVRRFNQTRPPAASAPSSRARGAARGPARGSVRDARLVPGPHPVRERHLGVGQRAGHPRDVDQADGVPGINLMPGSTEQDFVLFSHPVMLAGTARTSSSC
jgi:hypothetical protein